MERAHRKALQTLEIVAWSLLIAAAPPLITVLMLR